MTAEEWQRIRPILESALELDPASRAGFLDGACEDPVLRREVESLIASHDEAGTSLLNGPAVPALALEEELRFRLEPGKRVGPYEIVGEIAQGGMGAVYRAVRADGQYSQQVALKIVRFEFGGEFTAARFRNERQILARLDHPNIAKILDGGSTADGVPYFVMELIDGLPITEYCDQHKLNVDARLAIFRTVCSAVHYAHQHLVIHRDIKPTNILVTVDGIPKLLDFGIAKILDPSALPENLTLTGGAALMTPEYASPEQLRGEAITTATDVYSLGLVLYELLSGHRPYHFASHMPHDIARAVLETEPEKPSTATARKVAPVSKTADGQISTAELLSRLRSDSPEKLRKRLAGDLDNIVLKAIRKEPASRYSSADQLSDDIRRHVEGLPVLARKNSWAYRSRKYVMRHKVGVSAAALIFLSLFGGLILTLREARIAKANELRAERRFNDVRALANSLIWEVHDSIRTLPGSTAARKLILQRAQEYLDGLAAESKSDPSLMRELAAAYNQLGNLLGDPRDANVGNTELAQKNYRRALELREAAVAAAPTNAQYRLDLAEAYLAMGIPSLKDQPSSPREVLFQKGMSILEPLAKANPKDLHIQYDFGKAFEHKGQAFANSAKWEEAKASYKKSLEIYQQLSGADPKRTSYATEVAFAHKHLGGCLIQQGQYQAALAEYLASLAIDEAQLKEDPRNILKRYNITFSYSDIGYIKNKQGDVDGALEYYHKAFEIRSALVQEDPQDTKARAGLARTYEYIAGLLQEKGDVLGSLENDKKALALRQTLYESDPTNAAKRSEFHFSETAVGRKYAALAFQPKTSAASRAEYCRQAESWFQKGLPEFRQHKDEVIAGDAEFVAAAEQDVEKCSAILAGRNRPKANPAAASHP